MISVGTECLLDCMSLIGVLYRIPSNNLICPAVYFCMSCPSNLVSSWVHMFKKLRIQQKLLSPFKCFSSCLVWRKEIAAGSVSRLWTCSCNHACIQLIHSHFVQLTLWWKKKQLKQTNKKPNTSRSFYCRHNGYSYIQDTV